MDGFVNLLFGLARAVEDYLVGAEACAQGLEEFAAAVDLAVNTRVANRREQSHRRVGLRGVEEADGVFDALRRELQTRDVRADALLGEDEEGRVVLARERRRVNAVNEESAFARFEVAGDRPSGGDRRLCHVSAAPSEKLSAEDVCEDSLRAFERQALRD